MKQIDTTNHVIQEQTSADPFLNLGFTPSTTTQKCLPNKIENLNLKLNNQDWKIKLETNTEFRPALSQGIQLLDKGAAIIVGMSLGNSYFSKENILRLFSCLPEISSCIYIVPMDQPSEHNFRAMGYTENEIRKKIKRKSAEIHSDIKYALKEIDSAESYFKLVNWDQVRNSYEFKIILNGLENLSENNTEFQSDLFSTTKAYLSSKIINSAIQDVNYKIAQKYLLEELSFLLCATEIFNQSQMVYLYHREWSIYEKLITGAYFNNRFNHLGFVEMKIAKN